ncbi:MAG TPA: MarR family winged helix-turn-helix transcriptional regulator [Ktedonobacterales bacterium]|nr:MarR family winged helix-turn-helix transcriptional regulator [Ktedonobacterales bacterium]
MNTQEVQDFEAKLLEMQNTCLCYNVRKAARLVTQFYDTVMEPSGLLGTQFVLLRAIGRAGAATLTRLSQAIGMDRTTLTRNLRPLERQGFVEMDAGLDRRTHIVRLTEQGRQAMAAALPFWGQAQTALVSRFGQERSAALLNELRALEAEIQPA